jgi:hypothetical protein
VLEQTRGLGLAQGKGDKISLSQSTGLATINVRHVSGIGALRLTRLSGQWPEKIKLVWRNFPYLENVTISGGTEKVIVEGQSENCRRKTSKRVIFLPAAIVRNDIREIDVSWVDAYR